MSASNPHLQDGTFASLCQALQLSFPSKDNEAAFLSWHEKAMLPAMFRALLGLALSFLMYSCLEVLYLTFDLQEWDDFPVNILGPRLLTISAAFVIALACGNVSACIWMRIKLDRLLSVDLEARFVACMVFLAFGSSLANRHSSAEMFGQEPADVWGSKSGYSRINLALVISLSMASVCTFVPVRFDRMLLLAVLNVLAVTVEYTLSSVSTAGGVASLLLLCSVIGCLLRGAWTNEQHLRADWETSRLAQAKLQSAKRVLQDPQHKDQQKKEQRKESQERMQGVLVELPGILPVLPAQSGTASHGGSSLLPCRGASRMPGNISGALDGTWRCSHPSREICDWLRYLCIKGPRLIDGQGRTCLLHQTEDGSVIFRGGALHIDDGVLIRMGNHSILSFLRVRVNAGEEEEDENESDSDRESILGDGDLTWASPS